MPRKDITHAPPNASCVICGIPLRRYPYELRTCRFVSCSKHRGEAQKAHARTEAQNANWEALKERQRLAAIALKKARESEAALDFVKVPAPAVVGLSPITRILIEVSGEYGVSVAELRAPGRSTRYLFKAISRAARRLRTERNLSFSKIGYLLGGRHPSSIENMVYGNRKHVGRRDMVLCNSIDTSSSVLPSNDG